MNPEDDASRRTAGPLTEDGPGPAVKAAVLACLLALTAFQAWAYFAKMQLWLGPRVLLQPWLLSRGFVMYRDIIDLHAPLMPLALSSLVPLFPDGVVLAKTAMAALLTLSTLLTFELGRHRIGWFAGLWAAGFFVIWSPALVFFKLWHESLLVPIYLLWLFFDQSSAGPRPVRSALLLGFLGGVAVLIKQHAALPFAAFVLWGVFNRRHYRIPWPAVLRETAWILLGMTLPVLAYCVFQLLTAGSLDGFLYWTVRFNLVGKYKSIAAQRPTVTQIGKLASLLLLMPAALLSLVDARRRGDPVWLLLGMLLLMTAAGSVTAYPRFEFFHLQPILPMAALTSSLVLAYAIRRKDAGGRPFAAGVAAALSFFWLVTAGYEYRPVIRPEKKRPVWEYSSLQPLAEEIRRSVPADQSLYIFPDSEVASNLYYLLAAEPPRYWVFHYPWYLQERVVNRIIRTLETDPPDWIIQFPDRYGTLTLARGINRIIEDRYRREARIPWTSSEVWLLRRIVPDGGTGH